MLKQTEFARFDRVGGLLAIVEEEHSVADYVHGADRKVPDPHICFHLLQLVFKVSLLGLGPTELAEHIGDVALNC